MSSDLPSRPNLEYLKKRAKERLRELQQKDPTAKLADAQHAVAREYGFLNWSQLKESVAAAARVSDPATAPPPTASLFARFTTRARQALFFSRFEAGEFGHPSIDPEHVLLGMVRARFGAARLYAKSGLSLERIRADVSARRHASEPLSIAVIIAFSDETKRAVQFAAEEADRRHHDTIGTPHLLLGLLHDERSIASAILRDDGVTLEHVRDVIQDLIDEETSA